MLRNLLILPVIVVITTARPYNNITDLKLCNSDSCPFPCVQNVSTPVDGKEISGICSTDPPINFKIDCLNPDMFKCDDHAQCPVSYKCCETLFVPFKVCKPIKTATPRDSVTFKLDKTRIVYSTDQQTILSLLLSKFQYNLTLNRNLHTDLDDNIRTTIQILNKLDSMKEYDDDDEIRRKEVGELLRNATDSSDRLSISIPLPGDEILKYNVTETNLEDKENEFITSLIPTSVNPEMFIDDNDDDSNGSGNYETVVDDEDYVAFKDYIY